MKKWVEFEQILSHFGEVKWVKFMNKIVKFENINRIRI